MSAPITDHPSSISSSGHVDGLGRRLLAFDRETGAILERLHLRPELAAFELAIRERIDQLASFDDERFARPGSVERDPATGDLTVLSEFVAGSHLSDLLETADEGGLVPGVEVALGFLLEALPAISSFHSAAHCSHGLIAPTRTILTPAGQVVFLDPALGSVVERLGLSKSRLWVELGIAAPQSSGVVRLDAAADIAQVALSAVMLVIGRCLREHEYPDALPSLLMEVVEVAQIRGSSVFATSLQRLLQRSLPLPGRRPFASADEMANEIRLLLRREIGAEVCRQALIDFTEQMDAQFSASRSSSNELPAAFTDEGLHSGNGHSDLDLDQVSLDALDSIEVLHDENDDEECTPHASAQTQDEEQEEFEEISLEPDFLDEADLPPLVRREPGPEPILFDDEPVPEPASPAGDTDTRDPDQGASEAAADAPPAEVTDPWSFDSSAVDRVTPVETPAPLEPAAEPVAEPPQPAPVAPEPLAAEPAPEESPISDSAPEAAPIESELPQEDYGSSSSRRKKRQQKSARARKDRLRSASESKPQPAKAPESRPQSGWLVNPDRAAAFAPAVVEATAPQPAPVIGHAAPPPPVMYAAAPPPQVVAPPVAAPVPVRTAIPMPVYGAPTSPPSIAPAPAPAAPIAVVAPAPRPATPSNVPVRLKAEAPSGYAPPRSGNLVTALPYVHRGPMFEAEPPRAFPWKLAIAALVLVGIAIVVGRQYIPSTPAPDETAANPAAPNPEPPAVVVMPTVETGDITIVTQPAGARVLLDGKPVGQSPLKLAAVPVGRHTLTFVSASGEVTRTVRVAAGQTSDVDISIFSGWVAVFAPVVLDVAVNGRSIGTTEQNRLMLPPGRHELTLTNQELGYKGVQEVEVQPGEVRSLTVDPRGPVNFNAIPWAEVWLDGQKLGDTPLANMRVPLGTREFVFKHPQFGERKVTASIRADQPAAIGVDFTRPQ
jgi:PEGA domain